MQLLIQRFPNWNPVSVQKAEASSLEEGNPPNESIQVGGGKESNFAISLVTASEKETGQTEGVHENVFRCGVVDYDQYLRCRSRTVI